MASRIERRCAVRLEVRGGRALQYPVRLGRLGRPAVDDDQKLAGLEAVLIFERLVAEDPRRDQPVEERAHSVRAFPAAPRAISARPSR